MVAPNAPITLQPVRPIVTGDPWMTESPPRSPHFVQVVHSTGGVIRGYTHLAKCLGPSTTV